MTQVTRWIVALACAGLMMGLVLASAAHAQDAPARWSSAPTAEFGR